VSRALQAELIKLRTTRTFVALVGSALGLSLLVVTLIASLSNNVTEDDLQEAFGSTDTTGLFILLLGVIGMAGEWRHRTIASTVLAVPQRIRLMAAKVLAYAVGGIVLSLVVNLASMAIGTLIFSARGEETLAIADLIDILWRNLVVAAYFGGLGVCVGALIRNPAVAIVVMLVLSFVVDGALFGLAFDVWKFGPLGGTPSAITQVDPDGSSDLLPLGVGLLLVVGWLGALFAAATATFTQRDLV
jgi:ABC-type transport system involved in multi-copper enzyme maturation permease subunit